MSKIELERAAFTYILGMMLVTMRRTLSAGDYGQFCANAKLVLESISEYKVGDRVIVTTSGTYFLEFIHRPFERTDNSLEFAISAILYSAAGGEITSDPITLEVEIV